jgi:hypothetical protein
MIDNTTYRPIPISLSLTRNRLFYITNVFKYAKKLKNIAKNKYDVVNIIA